MTALATASMVLAWAADPVSGPPSGDLLDVESLAQPGARATDLLRGLAVRTAAVLGTGKPPFGDAGPVGLGALLLAAAVGGRAEADAARQIAAGVPQLRLLSGPDADPPGGHPLGWADAVARHGVAGPVIQRGPVASHAGELIEHILAASPLTAVLIRPPTAKTKAGDYREPLEAVMDLLGRPRGAEVLTTALAAPTKDFATLTWRTAVLSRLLGEHRDMVLSVYLTARVRHGREWDELLDWAVSALGRGAAILRFWMPLAILDREDPELLRSRPFLDGHRRAIDLAAPYVHATASASAKAN
jgi:hypothetical protein